ncbi:MAG: GDSL-type esterase/lipase family protein [Polyangiaceae bacterium]
MSTGQLILLITAAGLLLWQAFVLLTNRGTSENDDEPNYPDPKLQLDTQKTAHELFGELDSTLAVDHDADERYLQAGGGDPVVSEAMPVAQKMIMTGALVWFVVALPYVVPGLEGFQLLSAGAAPSPAAPSEPVGGPLPSASVGEAKLPGATQDQQARGKELDAPIPDSRGPIARGGKSDAPDISAAVAALRDKDGKLKVRHSIDDFSGKGLDKFLSKLARVDRKEKGAIARIQYYGDSIVASDFVTGKLRRLLQSRFGDAGHGYAIIANAWPGWFHIDVSRKASAEWKVSTCVGPYAKDALYGLGCASFQSYQADVWTRFGTSSSDRWGREVSRFEVEYLAQPGGGSVEVKIDGKVREPLDTNAAETRVAYRSFDVPDGPHDFELRTTSDKATRLFGIRMERDRPGVVLSAAGITGARVRFLDKQDNEHFGRVLSAAKPDLVVLAFGSNEVTDGLLYPMDKFRETLGAVMAQIEAAVPDASYMLAGPPAMASKNAAHGHSRAVVPIIVKNQIQVAKERGWAYWNQYAAMGGAGSMWAWMKGGLGSQDMFHPTGQGGNLLGRWQYQAIVEAYTNYLARTKAP